MKSSMTKIALGLASVFAFASVAGANELLVTDSGAKRGGQQLALDFVNSGDATALEFEVSVPKGVTPNTSKCVSEIPKTHVGACKFNEKTGKIVVMVYSNENAKLPAGMVAIGTIATDSMAKGGISASNLLVADASAAKLSATITGDAAAVDGPRSNQNQNQAK